MNVIFGFFFVVYLIENYAEILAWFIEYKALFATAFLALVIWKVIFLIKNQNPMTAAAFRRNNTLSGALGHMMGEAIQVSASENSASYTIRRVRDGKRVTFTQKQLHDLLASSKISSLMRGLRYIKAQFDALDASEWEDREHFATLTPDQTT